MPDKKRVECWSTEHEIEFINNLGIGKPNNRARLFKAYLEGIKRRTVWENIDRILVTEKAERMLRYHKTKEEAA